MAAKVKVALCEVFDECQRTVQCHAKLLKKIIKIYEATDFDTFWEPFVAHMKCALVIFEREPAVMRCLEFIAKFATSLKGTEEDTMDELARNAEDEEKGELNKFLLKLFAFCLNHHNACDHGVRFRVCQLINKLLYKMGEDVQIDDDLYDKIYECMLQRLRDLYPIVRIQAVFALTRLQDPEDQDCPVINAYLFLLTCDANSDVRRAVLTCIAASTRTLPAILDRTRDVKDAVRCLAYHVIAEKVHIRALTIAQRITLLDDGLKDRVAVVKDACTTQLIQAWLKSFQGNILELLRCLDVENSEDTARLALTAIFTKSPATELVQNFDLLSDKVIGIDDLSCESALYWRSLTEHLASLGSATEELLEHTLPTPSHFAKYLKSVYEARKDDQDLDAQLTNEFILQQLLNMASLLDLSDEAGRRAIGQLVQELLVSEKTTYNLVRPLVALYSKYQRDPTSRINMLCEVIADTREPITVVEDPRTKEERRQIEIKVAKVRVELNELREELEKSVSSQDFSRAAEIKDSLSVLEESKVKLLEETEPRTQEVRTERTDTVTLFKCLTIAAEMLECVTFRNLLPSLQTLIESLILPGVQNEDPAIRNMALKSLGMCCQMNAMMAKAHLLLFITVSQMDVEAVKVTALKAIFDLLLTFGVDAFQLDDGESESDPERGEGDASHNLDDSNTGLSERSNPVSMESKTNTAASLLSILSELLGSQVSEVRTVAAEGLAKLLLAGRIVSPKLISRLLLLWYNPVTEDDTHLRHCLGAFFPFFAFGSLTNQVVVEEAFLPTLRTLFNAPASSPLAEVDAMNVTELLVQLTNTRHLLRTGGNVQDYNCHDSLAVSLCNEILREPDDFGVQALCKALKSLELTKTHSGLKDLAILADSLLKAVKDKQCRRALNKFQQTISTLSGVEAKDAVQGTKAKGNDDLEIDVTQNEGRTHTSSEQASYVSEVQASQASEPSTSEQQSQQGPLNTEVDADVKMLTEDDQEKASPPATPGSSRTALGQVHINTPGHNSPERETEQEEPQSRKHCRQKASVKATAATTSKRRTQTTESDTGSEMENTATLTPVRRSARTRKGKTETETSSQNRDSQVDSPLQKKMRAKTPRRGAKQQK